MTSKRSVRFAALGAVAAVGGMFAAFGHASVPGAVEAYRTWGQPATTYLAPSVDTRFRSRIDYRNFDQRIGGIMTDPSMVGLSVAVIEDGRITFARGYGTTQAVGGTPVEPRTVFRWASLSKGAARFFCDQWGKQFWIGARITDSLMV